MTRYLVAAGILAAYVAGSVWFVRREGESYRASLRPAPDASVAGTDRPDAPPEPMPVAPADPEPVAVATPPPAPAHVPEPAAVAVAPPAPAEVVRPDVAPRQVPPAPAERPKAAGLWDSPLMKRSWDVENLKPEGEKELGGVLNGLVMGFHREAADVTLVRRVAELAEPFLAARSRKEIDYTFTVLESDGINAFSHPGGYVYVTTGLVQWVGGDQPYALEFVLAHEIAHVDAKHALTCLRDPDVRKLGTPAAFLTLFFPFAFPDSYEFEADRWANNQMLRLDRTKRERLAFLRMFDGYATEEGFGNGRVHPKPNAGGSPLENHFRAHPAAYKRLKRLEGVNPPAGAAPANARGQ